MIGLVISDKFLLTGNWEKGSNEPKVTGISKIDFAEPITKLLHHEGSLNAILASALRQAKDISPFSGQNIVIGLPDEFVSHSVLDLEQDLSKDEHFEYISWLESQKDRPHNQSIYIYGQIYSPGQDNIHVCTVPRALVRTLRLSIAEMGANPFWMGPVSSMYLDGSGFQESALIHRIGNKYSYLKIQNNRFGTGSIVFSGGVPKVKSTTDISEEITLSALGLEKSEHEELPIFSAQKLGRQAKNAWELSDFRVSHPFKGIVVDSTIKNLPYYESNILTKLITGNSLDFSFNFFHDEGITEFFFEEVNNVYEESQQENNRLLEDKDEYESLKEKKKDVINNIEHNRGENLISVDDSQNYRTKTTSYSGFALAVLIIVGGFIGFNYLKLQGQLNNNIFGIADGFTIQRSGIDDTTSFKKKEKVPPSDLIKESRAISSSILNLLTQTDLNRYNGLTITKSFLSLEYMSGINPNIENILGLDPSSFSVEATGKDSTVFLWYYSFELPLLDSYPVAGELNKMDLMIQLDTTLSDYSLKYFEQVYTRNQIYGPLLIWVRGKADILQASAIISNLNNTILLRKFVLFNKSDQPSPRAGFYVSILED